MQKRALLVSYEFPPKGGTQSQHVAKLAKGLAEAGWELDVITVADPPASLIDPRLAEELPPSVRRHGAWSLEPTRLVQIARRLRRRRTPAAAATVTTGGARGFTSLPRWAIRLVQAFFIPDEKRGWVPFAVREGLEVAAERRPQVVIATGPAYSGYTAGRKLARRLGLPLLVDLRDPIVGSYFFRPPTPLHRWLMARFERRTVMSADRIILATDGMTRAFATAYPRRSAVMETYPNGFDPADFADPPQPHEGFVVSYVGTFQASIRPDVFLDALARLRAADPRFAEDVRVRFVGPLDPDTSSALESRGLDGVVERTGFVTHETAVAAMAASDVLLLVLGPEEASRDILTSKLPEYLGARKPVLALVPTPGVAADVVERSGAGAVVHPLDVDGTERALRDLYEAWRGGRPARPSEEVVAQFDRSVLARRLDRMLLDLIGDGRPG